MDCDDTLKAGYCLTHYPLFIFTDAILGNIYITNSIKCDNNGSAYARKAGQNQTKKLCVSVCLHWISNGSQRGKKEQAFVFYFFVTASQTELLTKWPIWATSFHSDWPNWDLLTESPIRAGTGQSAAGICHLHHTGLPAGINALSVSATLMTFLVYERFNCFQNP